MNNLSDETLLELFAQGNNAAFDKLLFRYKDKLYNYIYFWLQNREMAEDVFQETFTKVIIKVKEGRYNEMGRFGGFLFRIAHNIMVDQYRSEQTAQFVRPGEAGYDLFNNKELSDSSLEDKISDIQIKKDVKRLIMYLPENQQEIIRMRYYQGISFKDIALMKGISINTALGRMHYAIHNMRRLAKEHNISLSV